MNETILKAISNLLNEHGIYTIFDYEALDTPTGLRVALSFTKSSLSSAAFGEYMGVSSDGVNFYEVYGYKNELDISLKIYTDSYSTAATDCKNTCLAIQEALNDLPSSIRIREMCVDELTYNKTTGLYSQEITLDCRAYLLRDLDIDTGEFLDFRLRGAIN